MQCSGTNRHAFVPIGPRKDQRPRTILGHDAAADGAGNCGVTGAADAKPIACSASDRARVTQGQRSRVRVDPRRSGRQGHKARVGVVATDVAQRASRAHPGAVQGQRLGCRRDVALDLQRGTGAHSRACRCCAQRSRVLNVQYSRVNRGQAAVGVRAREREPARTILGQRAGACADAAANRGVTGAADAQPKACARDRARVT